MLPPRGYRQNWVACHLSRISRVQHRQRHRLLHETLSSGYFAFFNLHPSRAFATWFGWGSRSFQSFVLGSSRGQPWACCKFEILSLLSREVVSLRDRFMPSRTQLDQSQNQAEGSDKSSLGKAAGAAKEGCGFAIFSYMYFRCQPVLTQNTTRCSFIRCLDALRR